MPLYHTDKAARGQHHVGVVFANKAIRFTKFPISDIHETQEMATRVQHHSQNPSITPALLVALWFVKQPSFRTLLCPTKAYFLFPVKAPLAPELLTQNALETKPPYSTLCSSDTAWLLSSEPHRCSHAAVTW